MDLKDEFHFSCLFIAHDLSVVRHISDRLGVMYLGAWWKWGISRPCSRTAASLYKGVVLSGSHRWGETIGGAY